MSKVTALFIVALLLGLALSYTAGAEPAISNVDSAAKAQNKGVETEQVGAIGENCEGFREEECLMRRTLAAHLDYVYTQKTNP